MTAWRAGTAVGEVTPKHDFIVSSSAPAFLTAEHVEGTKPPAEYNGLPVVGSYGKAFVVESHFIPKGYVALVASSGADDSDNPIAVREHENSAYRGLRLIPGGRGQYPLIDASSPGPSASASATGARRSSARSWRARPTLRQRSISSDEHRPGIPEVRAQSRLRRAATACSPTATVPPEMSKTRSRSIGTRPTTVRPSSALGPGSSRRGGGMPGQKSAANTVGPRPGAAGQVRAISTPRTPGLPGPLSRCRTVDRPELCAKPGNRAAAVQGCGTAVPRPQPGRVPPPSHGRPSDTRPGWVLVLGRGRVPPVRAN